MDIEEKKGRKGKGVRKGEEGKRRRRKRGGEREGEWKAVKKEVWSEEGKCGEGSRGEEERKEMRMVEIVLFRLSSHISPRNYFVSPD